MQELLAERRIHHFGTLIYVAENECIFLNYIIVFIQFLQMTFSVPKEHVPKNSTGYIVSFVVVFRAFSCLYIPPVDDRRNADHQTYAENQHRKFTYLPSPSFIIQNVYILG